jgi:hypothetical protein
MFYSGDGNYFYEIITLPTPLSPYILNQLVSGQGVRGRENVENIFLSPYRTTCFPLQ